MVIYVIIPVFNVEKYLKRCLDSLLAQTYKKILLICVNDGSTDTSPSILCDYKNRNQRKIIVINKKNGGLASARNCGLEYVKSIGGFEKKSFLTFVDSDDYLDSNYLEILLSNILINKTSIICSSYYGIQENGDGLYKKSIGTLTKINSFDALCKLFSDNLQSHSWSILYESKLWTDLRFDESKRFMEDQPITFQLFIKAQNISTIDYAGYYYVHRLGSLCQSSMTNSKIIDALTSYIFTYQYNFGESGYQQNEISVLRMKIANLFADIFLMMYPRFKKSAASPSEMKKWKAIVGFAKQYRVILHFNPKTKKQKIKKYIYLYVRPFYKPLFYFFKKNYD